MGPGLARILVDIAWCAFLVVWAVSGRKTLATKSAESLASRFGVLFIQSVGCVFLFGRGVGFGILGRPFLAPGDMLTFFGVGLSWAGVAVAIWARYHLGKYWSSQVTIKEDHKLIRTGPYARIRHPIYSGLVLAATGTALTIDRWRCVIGVGLILLALAIKARKEENLLGQQFGEDFVEHRHRTGFLLPRFR